MYSPNVCFIVNSSWFDAPVWTVQQPEADHDPVADGAHTPQRDGPGLPQGL